MKTKPIKLKDIIVAILITLFVVVTILFILQFNSPNYSDFTLEDFKSSDAKLAYHGYVVTSKEDHLYLINSNTEDINEVFIRSNWIDTLVSDNIIVYSSQDKLVGICHFDPSDASIINNYEIIKDNRERIDPSIVKLGHKYFLTTTIVDGLVNRASIYEPNGTYTIQLFESDDLITWRYVTDIITRQSNLEDVELNADDNHLRMIFEVETVDKGPSRIEMMESFDQGRTWSEPLVLIDNGADNEPASFCKANDEYWLFFSSDLNNPGQSYSGSQAFLAKFDHEFNHIETVLLNTNNDDQILLYEAIVNNGISTVLYSKDYLGNDDLCLETKRFSNLETLGN